MNSSVNKIKNSIFENLPKETLQILNDFDSIVQSVRPMSSKQLLHLPDNIRQLSHQLTDERGSRRNGYLNETVALSAYVRYFQWWNLVRLTKLFSGLSEYLLDLPDDGVCIDIGSGPLTVPIALWLACPKLRKKRFTWYCVDYSQTALSFGEDLFLAIVAKTIQLEENIEPWKIIRIKGELGVSIKNTANFIVCANVFNEIVQNSEKPPEFSAKRATEIFHNYGKNKALVLVIEPGTPPSVRFLAALRNALFRKNYEVLSPCPFRMCTNVDSEKQSCPMDGSKGKKWCHFVFSTENAPAKLLKISKAAGIPKDRASLSFLLLAPTKKESKKEIDFLTTRIISEPINLPNEKEGFYACSSLGLTLVVLPKDLKEKYFSGQLLQLDFPKYEKIDYKSGAKIVQIKSSKPTEREKNERSKN